MGCFRLSVYGTIGDCTHYQRTTTILVYTKGQDFGEGGHLIIKATTSCEADDLFRSLIFIGPLPIQQFI